MLCEHVGPAIQRAHGWAHYTANATGTVNVSEDPSLGGTYSGVEPMGLLWSLQPVPGSKPGLRLRKMNVQTLMEVVISVYQGQQTEGFVDQVPLGIVLVERWYMAPGVCRIPVTECGLTGTIFLPPGPGPFPGILDLWGGGGLLVECRAALMASHGFACLALDYLKIPQETGKMVDNEYFETAYRVLQQHPRVLGSKIAMLGFSLGSSVTLKMAVYSKVIKLRCAVCISGSHVQPADGSMADIFGYWSKNASNIRFNEENQMISRDLLLPIPTDPSLKVDIQEMMEQAGNSHLLTTLLYQNTGHLIEPPYTPHTRTSIFRLLVTREMLCSPQDPTENTQISLLQAHNSHHEDSHTAMTPAAPQSAPPESKVQESVISRALD